MIKNLWVVLLILSLLLTACDASDDNASTVDDGASAINANSGAFTGAEENQQDDNGLFSAEETAETYPAPAVQAEQSPTVQAEFDAFSESAACPFDVPGDFDLSCGYLTVPENRSLPDSPSIELAYAIVHAAQDEGRPPIVYLAGGPGASAIDDFVSDPEGWGYPFTAARDLVLIDQRGTGYSLPSLDCPELAEEVSFADENPEQVCHARLLAEGIDLAAYNTAENAADVAALRQALGIESWDLLGISYGTRLALEIMRSHPEGVRSVVLDSVFPPNADTPGQEALSSLWSLKWLFTECAADDYCNENYPDLESVFLDTVAALNDSPQDGVFGDDFAFTIMQALNDTQLIPLVPLTIYAVADGDMRALDELADDDSPFGSQRYQDDTDHSDSEGMYNSVICHDEYIFGDYESAEAQLLGEAPPELEAVLLQGTADLFQVCSYWGAGAAGPEQNEPVYSAIPTLILAGQYDNATPPEWAALAAETLSQVFVFEFPGAGHSLLSSDECAIAITADFLDHPEQTPDASCIDNIDWPYFE